jgi:type IV pilus assembly protein PilP
MMSNYLKKLNILTVTPAVMLLIGGCSKDVNDLYTFIENEKASNVGSVKPIPQFKPYESFSYTAAELRDPFESNVEMDQDQASAADALHPETNRPKQPLEAFPLDTLAMVGTLEQKEDRWGLIKDPQNIVHRVKLGNYMGQNEGRILEITETDIRLVEVVPDGIGGFIERDASIAIGNE